MAGEKSDAAVTPFKRQMRPSCATRRTCAAFSFMMRMCLTSAWCVASTTTALVQATPMAAQLVLLASSHRVAHSTA